MDQEKIEEILGQVSKPGRYIGNEWNSVKKDLNRVSIKFALAFPDLYEVGMSHLGFKLLYHLLNEREDIACERIFSPDIDLEEILRKESLPIFTLESKSKLLDFDIIGFSLAYELNGTNALNILELSNIPLRAKDRDENHPLIIAGGPSALNPEPMSDFVDLFIIGEAEEAIFEVIDVIKEVKREAHCKKQDLLKRLNRIEGAYVPAFYRMTYNEDGTLNSIKPFCKDIPSVITRRSVKNLNRSFYPTKQIVPYIRIVHDRVSVEIMRGCPNHCKFCQARVLYHHKRERSLEEVVRLAQESIKETGYEEVSLLSLSSGNHSQIIQIINSLTDTFKSKGISISLPSLRIEKILKKLPTLLNKIRKSGLTFAPEAGSKRLRSFINKDIDMEELMQTIDVACNSGWRNIKLYFMLGLPTESYKDIDGIVNTINDILDRNRKIHINVSISPFVPKPHTPFQLEPMEREENLKDKMAYIAKRIKSKRVKLKFHNISVSILEAVFSRGDRRLGRVMLRAFKKGCKFDSWIEHLKFEEWMNAFRDEDIDPHHLIHRKRDCREILPWHHIYCGLTKDIS